MLPEILDLITGNSQDRPWNENLVLGIPGYYSWEVEIQFLGMKFWTGNSSTSFLGGKNSENSGYLMKIILKINHVPDFYQERSWDSWEW